MGPRWPLSDRAEGCVSRPRCTLNRWGIGHCQSLREVALILLQKTGQEKGAAGPGRPGRAGRESQTAARHCQAAALQWAGRGSPGADRTTGVPACAVHVATSRGRPALPLPAPVSVLQSGRGLLPLLPRVEAEERALAPAPLLPLPALGTAFTVQRGRSWARRGLRSAGPAQSPSHVRQLEVEALPSMLCIYFPALSY